MQASFEVITATGLTLREDEIAARFDELLPDLADIQSLEGILILYNDTGSYRVTALRDVLGPLITQFCFNAIPELAAGKDLTLELFAYNERVQLHVAGDEVEISGDELRGDRCPRKSLLVALTDCGDRFLALLQRVYGEDEAWQESLAAWQAASERAHASLPSN